MADRYLIPEELRPAFEVVAPARQRAPFVLCSPHSGRVYPRAFLEMSPLDPLTLRKSEDCFVDELFAPVAALGIPMLVAHFPRAYLDVNREPYELDPDLFDEPLPDYVNSGSVRVAGGLGTIARVVADGDEIYRNRLPLSEALMRIERFYIPFHATLAELIEQTRATFGFAILIDCHSMPSSSIAASGGPRPEMVIGDRYGASSDMRVSRFLRNVLTGLGYDVQMNRPYAGGYITEHYGRPAHGVHAVQLEINRGLYLDEGTLTLNAGFDRLSANLLALASALFDRLPLMLSRKAAAE